MKYRMKHAPMGWNSYDYYDTTVTEREVRANADYMAAHLKPYGWEYIVVDIQWYAKNTGSQREKYQYIPFGEVSMDEYGRLLPCTDRFPSAKDGVGFRALADYVHGLGLKLESISCGEFRGKRHTGICRFWEAMHWRAI